MHNLHLITNHTDETVARQLNLIRNFFYNSLFNWVSYQLSSCWNHLAPSVSTISSRFQVKAKLGFTKCVSGLCVRHFALPIVSMWMSANVHLPAKNRWPGCPLHEVRQVLWCFPGVLVQSSVVKFKGLIEFSVIILRYFPQAHNCSCC